jgi:hypothetical protein
MPEDEQSDLAALFKEVDSWDLKIGGNKPGNTASLVDESDPDGLVKICDVDGNLLILMPREDYESMRVWKPT